MRPLSIVVPGILLIVGITGGCLNPFAPKISESLETSDLVLTQQLSPEEVLQNFKVAYTFRDSLLYSDLLDTAFIFVYFVVFGFI